MDKIKKREDVPLMFRFMKTTKLTTDKSKKVKPTTGHIEFYQNEKFEFYSFYKPISKIVKIIVNENKRTTPC